MQLNILFGWHPCLYSIHYFHPVACAQHATVIFRRGCGMLKVTQSAFLISRFVHSTKGHVTTFELEISRIHQSGQSQLQRISGHILGAPTGCSPTWNANHFLKSSRMKYCCLDSYKWPCHSVWCIHHLSLHSYIFIFMSIEPAAYLLLQVMNLNRSLKSMSA